MDAAPGVIREKYRQRVLAVREQLEALAAPPRYRGFGVAFQYFSERADLGFIEWPEAMPVEPGDRKRAGSSRLQNNPTACTGTSIALSETPRPSIQ